MATAPDPEANGRAMPAVPEEVMDALVCDSRAGSLGTAR